MRLGALLREYDIRSANIRFPDRHQAKGYRRADFTDAWTRYCPGPRTDPTGGPEPSQPSQPSPPRSDPGRLHPWDGSKPSQPTSTRTLAGRLDPSQPKSRPAPPATGTAGTTGTTTPLQRISGGAA